jgi:hypothetical protein
MKRGVGVDEEWMGVWLGGGGRRQARASKARSERVGTNIDASSSHFQARLCRRKHVKPGSACAT